MARRALGLVIAWPAAFCLAAWGEPAFVRACGRHFEVGGQPFRFVGYNIRGIVHYGQNLPGLPFTSAADRQTNLAAARDDGIRVVRAFVAGKNTTPVQIGDRLAQTLALCRAHNIYLIACLTDYYIDSNMWPQGDEGYYATGDGGKQVLSAAWFNGGYETNYWPLVAYLVERFRDEDAIFAWEIGNELKLLSDPARFVAFMHDVRARIRALDGNHMITTGMISTRHTGISQHSEQARALYRDFDFITSHCYDGSDLEDQSALAAALNKPLVIEEVGFDTRVFTTAQTRVTALQNDMNKWFGRGAAGYMQWGFQGQANNIGDGDRYVGMDRYQHGDSWPGFVQAYSSRAAQLLASPPAPCPVEATSTPTPTGTPTRTPTPRAAPLVEAR